MRKRIIAGALLALVLLTLPGPAGAAYHATLRWGSRGSDVRLAQRKLRTWGYYRGSVDGVYGKRMYSAVILFQRRNGLRSDGVVGSATWAALGEPNTGRGGGGGTPARGVTRRGDLDLLSRVISAEARGEPYEGQVAVAAVILNRMRDPRFPSTLAGIVYEPDAFESVTNGSIYRRPTDQCVWAARDALNGWDPSGGAVFFWNPASSTSPWIRSRKIIKRIGNHVFGR